MADENPELPPWTSALPPVPESAIPPVPTPAMPPGLAMPVERVGEEGFGGVIPLAAWEAPVKEPVLEPEPEPQRVKVEVERAPERKEAVEMRRVFWPPVEEFEGRRWLVRAVAAGLLVIYAYMLSFYYTGAHGGVDQAGYLMTARLMAGEGNVDGPVGLPVVRKVVGEAVTGPGVTTAPAVARVPWRGGAEGYTREHPEPSGVQADGRWDFVRNRLSFIPESPFQFVSRMCIITEPYGPAVGAEAKKAETLPSDLLDPSVIPSAGAAAEYRVYAKYPPGYPLMAALGRVIAARFDKHVVVSGEKGVATQAAVAKGKGGPAKVAAVGVGMDGMYLVNPIATVLACWFAYLLFREAVSPFLAMIGVLWLGFNPLVLAYAHDANSHAPTLLCVTLGFYGLLSFLRTQQLWRAYMAGLALGYACTIRYSEFLLVLPVVFAAAINFRMTRRSLMGSLALITAWAVPVMMLAFVCLISFGSATKTGYTYCNEDTGFGWKYLTGDWADRTLTGNWETLITQINHIGLFILWPIALAGLFGMMGVAWRLGGILLLWVVPPVGLYLMYYWAPGGDTTTGYMRFFVSVMPGLIFAALWMLERALSALHAEKTVSLVIATLAGLGLLVVVAFYADGGPAVIDGGLGRTVWGLVTQTPVALWHLFAGTRMGAAAVMAVGAMVAGMWFFDEEILPRRLGVALGAGVITALGCAVNLSTILPQLDAALVRWSTLRTTVDNMREVLPRGTVVFCDDNMLNQLDCVGGWKLYDTSYFSTALYQQSKNRVEQRNNPERSEDPDPIQTERSRFYMELLTEPTTGDAGAAPKPRTQAEIVLLERGVIERNLAQGHRVTFLTLADAGDMGGSGAASGRITVPAFEGLQKKVLRSWVVSPAPSVVGRVFAAVPKGASTRPAPARQGARYVLYELVKAP